MRFLAYGQTSYSVICSIGKWSIPDGALSDVHGIYKDKVIFGYSALNDNHFLIFKKLNSYGNRPYPLSILLDPGLDIWNEYQWNAANLMDSLFGNPNSPGQELLSNPEKFSTEETLKKLFKKIVKKNVLNKPPDVNRFSSLCLLTSSITTDKNIVVSLEDFNFTERPSFEDIALLLEDLPICFRAGASWLIGAGEPNARAFGIKLVLDDNRITVPRNSSLDIYLKEGRDILYAWRCIKNINDNSNFSGSWEQEKYEQHPLWQWQDISGIPYRNILKDLAFITQLCEEKDIKKVVKTVENQLNNKGLFNEYFSFVLFSLIQTYSNSASPKPFTSLLLSKCFLALNQSKDFDFVNKLDQKIIVEEILRSGRSPKELHPETFPPSLRAEVWKSYIIQHKDFNKIPAMLNDAIVDLLSYNNNFSSTKEFRELCEKTFDKWGSSGQGSLKIWQTYPTAQSFLSELLSKEALNRVSKRGERICYEDYLAFGRDPGGKRLNEYNFPSQKPSLLLEFLLSKVDEKNNDAIHWIDSLANSPFRKRVPIKDKISIIEKAHKDNWKIFSKWRSFDIVHNLYFGEEKNNLSYYYEQQKSLNQEEKAYLYEELISLVNSAKEQPPNDNVPNLADLVEFFQIDGKFFLAFKCLQVSLLWENHTRWLEGWNNIDEEECWKQTLNFIRSWKEPITSNKDLTWIENTFLEKKPSVLSIILAELLTPSAVPQPRIDIFVSFLEYVSKRSHSIIAEKLQQIVQDSISRNNSKPLSLKLQKAYTLLSERNFFKQCINAHVEDLKRNRYEKLFSQVANLFFGDTKNEPYNLEFEKLCQDEQDYIKPVIQNVFESYYQANPDDCLQKFIPRFWTIRSYVTEFVRDDQKSIINKAVLKYEKENLLTWFINGEKDNDEICKERVYEYFSSPPNETNWRTQVFIAAIKDIPNANDKQTSNFLRRFFFPPFSPTRGRKTNKNSIYQP